jgi:hypothetical protein
LSVCLLLLSWSCFGFRRSDYLKFLYKIRT